MCSGLGSLRSWAFFGVEAGLVVEVATVEDDSLSKAGVDTDAAVVGGTVAGVELPVPPATEDAIDRSMRVAEQLDRGTAYRPGSALRLPVGPWATVLDCLCARFGAISREQWSSRMRRGLVRDAAGVPLSAAAPYRAGLEVRYVREVETEAPIPLIESIVYADADLVVADKPHFLPVAPAGRWIDETLLTRLMRRLDSRALVPLHRIDRATAGLGLFSAVHFSFRHPGPLLPGKSNDLFFRTRGYLGRWI